MGTAVGAMCPIGSNALWDTESSTTPLSTTRTLRLLNIVGEYTPATARHCFTSSSATRCG